MQITLREPGSALTHFIAMIMAVGAAVPLLLKAASHGSVCLLAMLVFIISMILLYGASATYHSVNLPASVIKILRKVDHSMIFVLIAGSYTPVCLLVLDPKRGYPLLIAVWSLALIGIGIKFLWITCPKWFSSVIYIAMAGSVSLYSVRSSIACLLLPLAGCSPVGLFTQSAGSYMH